MHNVRFAVDSARRQSDGNRSLVCGRVSRLFALLSMLVVGLHAAEASGADEGLSFERDIRPILRSHCFDCHGAGEQIEGNLDLRLRRSMVRGGDSGPAIEPGRAEESLLIERIRAGEMPPGPARVPSDEIERLAQWIAQGAATRRDEPESLPVGVAVYPEDREFWSFQPVRRRPVPIEGDLEAAHSSVDAFLLGAQRPQGQSLSPQADRRTLIRRLTNDLTGLPPQLEEVASFEEDPAPTRSIG